MITPFLREKTRRNKHKADVKFVNKTNRKFSGSISFGRCFGYSVLLVTIDIENFEFRQQRILPLNW